MSTTSPPDPDTALGLWREARAAIPAVSDTVRAVDLAKVLDAGDRLYTALRGVLAEVTRSLLLRTVDESKARGSSRVSCRRCGWRLEFAANHHATAQMAQAAYDAHVPGCTSGVPGGPVCTGCGMSRADCDRARAEGKACCPDCRHRVVLAACNARGHVWTSPGGMRAPHGGALCQCGEARWPRTGAYASMQAALDAAPANRSLVMAVHPDGSADLRAVDPAPAEVTRGE